MPRYIPSRGDAVWLSFSPQAGHQQAGRRPALIASPASYNRTVGLVLAWPITSQRKGYPFEASRPTAIQLAGVVLADQLKSLDWRVRRATFICRVPPAVVREALERVAVLPDVGEAQPAAGAARETIGSSWPGIGDRRPLNRRSLAHTQVAALRILPEPLWGVPWLIL